MAKGVSFCYYFVSLYITTQFIIAYRVLAIMLVIDLLDLCNVVIHILM